MAIVSLTAAEPGWKAIFGVLPEEETRSRIVAWGLDEGGKIVGLIVDPLDRASIVPAPDAVAPDGTVFGRYGYHPAVAPT